jgi:phosphoglycolate phosphatase
MAQVQAKPIRFAVFDCDGTLVDSQFVIARTMNLMFDEFGLPAMERTEIRKIIGLHLPEAIKALIVEAPRHVSFEQMAEAYKAHFFKIRESGDFHEPIFDHVVDVLHALAEDGVTIGMATGKSRRGAEYVLERHGLKHLFASIKTSDDGPGKPHPRILEDAMAQMNAAPEETVVIGDTSFDIRLAKNAGAGAIGVKWGYHTPEELEAAGADRLIGSFAEVAGALEEVWAA